MFDFLALKQQSNYQGVRIDKHTFGILRESPAMKLGECDAQLGTLQQRQIGGILRVQHVDLAHQIECGIQFDAHSISDAGRDQRNQLVFGGHFLQRVGYDQGAQCVRIICSQRHPSEFCEHSLQFVNSGALYVIISR